MGGGGVHSSIDFLSGTTHSSGRCDNCPPIASSRKSFTPFVPMPLVLLTTAITAKKNHSEAQCAQLGVELAARTAQISAANLRIETLEQQQKQLRTEHDALVLREALVRAEKTGLEKAHESMTSEIMDLRGKRGNAARLRCCSASVVPVCNAVARRLHNREQRQAARVVLSQPSRCNATAP